MAYFQITENKKGVLQAKIQVSGKDAATGKQKLFVKRIYNTEKLTAAKFRKQVEKISLAFEEEIASAYEEKTVMTRSRILTFSELMHEWRASIKDNLSVSYYERSRTVEKCFNAFLREQHLDDQPISAIKVRDVQMFFNSVAQKGFRSVSKARIIKDFPKKVNFRELEREHVINRCSSYGMRRRGCNIQKATALAICEYCNLDFDEYFEEVQTEKQYSVETLKGYRRILRTVFNEAIRYEWITKNPVCATKIGAGGSNTSLRAIPEKEVFSFREARDFLEKVDRCLRKISTKRFRSNSCCSPASALLNYAGYAGRMSILRKRSYISAATGFTLKISAFMRKIQKQKPPSEIFPSLRP